MSHQSGPNFLQIIDFRIWVYVIASVLYLFGVWAHIPYGGDHLYSDIPVVFQTRFCPSGVCTLTLPYFHTFVEYPVLTGTFIYLMGLLGQYLPLASSQGLVSNYYYWSAISLMIPTFLSISELFKVGEILGVRSLRKRTLLYFVATPSFVFMILTNWYIIGTFFALFGLRKFLQGSRWLSGFLLGISAAANLVTAVPAAGLMFATKDRRQAASFVIGGFAAFGAIYIPFLVLNPNFLNQFLSYQENWYIEGSWMLAIMSSHNPLRHVLFPSAFVLLSVAILLKASRMRRRLVSRDEWANYAVSMSSLFSFAWLFSSYVATPQTNVMLLPFFALLPMSQHYGEFLTFDVINSLIDVWGFSQPLLVLGITLSVTSFGSPYNSPIQALAVVKSLWIGKFLIYDGLLSSRLSMNRS